jgi:hypothetical protein
MPRAPRVATGGRPAGTLPRTSFGAAEARLSRREQDRFSYQMGRLLALSAAAFGLIGTIVSLVILWIPGVLAPGLAPLASIPLMLLAAAHGLAAWRPRDFLIVAVVSLGFVSLLVIGVLMNGAWNVGSSSAMGLIAALGIGGIAAVLVVSWREILLGAVAFVLTIALYLALLVGTPANLSGGVALIVTGWGVAATFGGWLGASFPRVMRRIGRIGRAYNIERRASETEARRLRDARLLHDTALATLTLLAHSGVGVNGEALRRQAQSDGELLRRLGLAKHPSPRHPAIIRSPRRPRCPWAHRSPGCAHGSTDADSRSTGTARARSICRPSTSKPSCSRSRNASRTCVATRRSPGPMSPSATTTPPRAPSSPMRGWGSTPTRSPAADSVSANP